MTEPVSNTARIYVVSGRDDRPEWWLVCAYCDEAHAKAHADEAARFTGDTYEVIELSVFPRPQSELV